jgi:RNA polymerase sigma factor (TIGR02999 family)
MSSPGIPEPTATQGTITDLLLGLRDGGQHVRDRLFDIVYDELRGIAHNALQRERAEHTLGTTDLVHEAYLKLVDQTRVAWHDRSHFFAVAARAMRRILVDYARRHGAAKRGGEGRRVPLLDDALSVDERADLLIELDDALNRLETLSPRLARVVECRFFAGLSEEETAHALGVTDRTVRRDWVKARGWLYRELGPGDTDHG